MKDQLCRAWGCICSVLSVLIWDSVAVAQELQFYEDEEGPTLKTHFYKLLTGGFGTLLIVICGLGGMATLLIMRLGKAGKNAPALGLIMLLIAAFIFAYRVLIKSGFLGHEFAQW